MIVSIHQPNYLPWLGYFYKIARCDAFVFLDSVAFSKNSYQNRCQVKTVNGILWLTEPVCTSGRFGQPTSEVEFDSSADWRAKHLRTIEMAYRRGRFFQSVFPKLEAVFLAQPWRFLADLNIALIEALSTELGLAPRFVRAGSLGTGGHNTDLLIDVCKALHATAYLSGSGGKKYQDVELFAANDIELRYSDFKHPRYGQLWGETAEGLSVIDLLMNHGPASHEILLGASVQNLCI